MHRLKLIVPGLVLSSIATAWWTVMVSGAPSLAADPARAPRRPSSNQPQAESSAERLNLRYAMVALRLAKVNLERAVDSNRTIEHSVSATEIERLRQLVKLAEDEVKREERAGSSDKSNANVLRAAANLKLATDEYRKAESANLDVPGTVRPLELERLRLTAELASLALARERASGDPRSTIAELQLQINQLRQEVQDLRASMAKLAQRGTSR